MSDRHLCKAKRAGTGEWVVGFYVRCRNHDYILPIFNDCEVFYGYDDRYDDFVEVDLSTICQCTEIGKEVGINRTVWENEIYQWEDAAYGKCTGIIRYGKYLQDGSGNEYPEIACYGFYAEIVKVEPYPGLDMSDYPTYLRMISVLEIFIRNSGIKLLGNIFDNPELNLICGATGEDANNVGKPDWCPLVPLPEKMPTYLCINSEKGYCEGRNDCIDASACLRKLNSSDNEKGSKM